MNPAVRRLKAQIWKKKGRRPHAYGYNAARWIAIEEDVRRGGDRYGWDGAGFDERVVEYPWVFDRMRAMTRPSARVLDAGSVLNHARVLSWWREAGYPPVSIVTLAPESNAFVSEMTRYEFGDLRELPYRDSWFTTVISLSTIEHVGLDNAVYGASSTPVSSDPDAEVQKALGELARVTIGGGTLLVSVPFGKRSNRGWFRIFDSEQVDALGRAPGWRSARTRIFRSLSEGWRECAASDAADAGYNEPGASGTRNAPPWVGGAEAVALLELTRA